MNTTADDQVEGSADAPRALFSPRHNSPGLQSPPPRKNSRSTGPLSKRLKSLRDSYKGDSVRLCSGQYPFLHTTTNNMSCLDRNDPRHRTHSYMDVTVVGDWEERKLLTVLAHVHSHVSTQPHGSVPAGVQVEQRMQPASSLVWLCVSYETAREQGLQVGSELRLYNVVVVPLEEKQAMTDGDKAKHPLAIVICTQLCEPYPAVLPKLPNVAELSE